MPGEKFERSKIRVAVKEWDKKTKEGSSIETLSAFLEARGYDEEERKTAVYLLETFPLKML